MKTYITRGSATTVVSTSDAKTHLRGDGNDEDTYIQALCLLATEYIERAYSLSLINRTDYYYLSDPFTSIDSPLSPISQVTAHVYQGGAWVSMSGIAFMQSELKSEIYLTKGASFPTYDNVDFPIRLTLTSGFGVDKTFVPNVIKQACLLLIGDLYRDRENSSDTTLKEIPMCVDMLLKDYKRFHF